MTFSMRENIFDKVSLMLERVEDRFCPVWEQFLSFLFKDSDQLS